MKEIDFLPARFRERDRQRRHMMGRMAVFGAITVILLAVQLAQVASRRSIERQLSEIAATFAQAAATSARVDRLRSDLAANSQFSELYTYLEHPWPRTQLITAVTQTLPEHLALTEVRIPPSNVPLRTVAPPPADESKKTAPASRDLQTLRDETDRISCEVILKGTSLDPAALHSYVAGFANSPYFSTAKLELVETLKDKGKTGGSRFDLRLYIRPGYGQTGGPATDAVGPDTLNRTASRDR
jgi:hypothetical protein